jgi:hypothetical protein
MTDNINFEAKTDRELLIMVAQAVNSLKEKTDLLWTQAQENKRNIELDKNMISTQEYRINEILVKQAECSKDTIITLDKINTLLGNHTERLGDFANMKKLFWWLVATLGGMFIALMGLVIKHMMG